LVERLLDKDPSRRPTSAGAVEAELTAIRVGQTLLGQRPGESGADTPERDTGFDEATRSTPVDSVQVITLLVSVVESRVSASQAAAEGAAVPAEPGSGRWVSDLRSRHGGREIRQDDLQLVLFDQPSSAVRYALAYHHGLEALAEQARIGIHLGEVVLRYNTPEDVARGAAPVEVEGPAPPTVSRLLALTSAGQTLLSRAAYAAARRRGRGEPDGELTWRCHGWYRFRDLADELEVFEVSRGAARPLAPPSGTSAWASGSGAATHGQAAAAVVGDPPEGCVPHEGRRAAVALRTWPAPEIPDQPYPVLLPYRHPKFLAGRDGEISRLRRLLQMPVPILGLSAPSGNGKSSLLIGGLVPKLRAAGVPVALVRHPTEAGLATRLIGDLLHGFEGPADDDPGRFVVGLGEAERLGGSPPVLVLDQFEDVLQQGAARARAALGVLMATSVTRRADSAGPPCRWLVAYRREFFGALREWLGDVLADARAEGATAIEALPHDLSSVDRFHGMSLSPLATPSPGVEDPLAESTRVFLAAIEAPLLPSDPAARGGATRSGATRSGATRDGPTRDDRTRDAAAPEGAAGEAASVRRFPWSFRPGHAERLARAFAAARLARPDAPLVPELQVVLAHLLAEADAEGRIAVPQDPAPLIDQALDHHLRRALEGAFPAGAATSSTRRARALLALRQLATAVGRRQEGLAASELARAIGHDGEAVLRRLATPLTRLVVPREGPEGLRWVLAHDRMAEAVVRLVEAEGRQGRLLIDAELLGLRRFVTLRTELFRSGATWTATLVSRRRFQRIEEHADALLTDGERRAWFDATRAHRQSAYRRWAALAGVALIVLALIGWLAWTQTELLAARRALREQVATGEPTTAFRALAHLAADLSTEPAELLGLLRQREAPADVLEWGLEGLEEPQRSVAVLRAVELALPWVAEQPEDPVLIGNLVWALDFAPARLPVLADQAAELRRQVLAPLRRQRPPPPRPAADDPQWIDVPAGTFLMGTADDQEGTADERPQHEVSVAAFRMQRHEVTLADYRQFEPGHQPGRAADLPAAYFSWHEAYTYAAWLGGRLPTEAEWE
ncbi:MAG: SUMF1/EgtB/PvdO family nonheme iron enzyme, partial [Acidobacteriota bacterium]